MCDSEVDWVDFVMFVVVPMHGNDTEVPVCADTFF